MKFKTIISRTSDAPQFDKAVELFCEGVKVEDIRFSNSDHMLVAVVIYGEKDESRTRGNSKAKTGKGKADGGEAQA